MADEQTLNLTARLEAFERAWASASIPAIEDCVADLSGEERLAILLEVIPIDLERRWKRQVSSASETLSENAAGAIERWTIEDYLVKFPELGTAENVGVELLQCEFRTRHRWGDRPQIAEYHERFPGRDGLLERLLQDTLKSLPRQSAGDGVDEATVLQDVGAEPLLQVLRDEELVPSAVLDGLEVDSAGSHDFGQLGRELLDRQLLTRWQVDRIVQGQTDRLRVGDYLILDELGAGGMGVVYKAVHQRMRRIVALKVLPGGSVDTVDAVRRFHQEVRAQAQLSHRNIATAFDAGEDGGVHYLVMEYVEGIDLRQHVKRNGAMPLLDALRCIIHAARGLGYAHQQGIVHRDVKPGNLLLADSQAVKVLDLGLARIDQSNRDPISGTEHSQITSPGSLMGTAEYMAPEQGRDTRTVDARSDIYSLGCTLHYLLTGRPPFRGETVMETMLAHHQSPIPSLRHERSDVPIMLEAVFQRMLAKEPQHRPHSMDEVVELLQIVRTQCQAAPLEEQRVDLRNHPDLTLEATIDSRQSGTAIDSRLVGPPLLNTATAAAVQEQQHRIELWKERDRFRRQLMLAAGLAAAFVIAFFIAWRSMTRTTITIEWPESERQGGIIEIDGRSRPVPAIGPIVITGRPGRREVTLKRVNFEDITKPFTLLSGESRVLRTQWLPTLASLSSGELTAISEKIDAFIKAADGDLTGREPSLSELRRKWMSFYQRSDSSSVRRRAEVELCRLPAAADFLDLSLTLDDGRNPLSVLESKSGVELVAVLGDSRLRHWSAATCAAFSPAGHLISGSSDGTVVAWDLKTGNADWSIDTNTHVTSLAVSTNGELAVAVYKKGEVVRLYDVETGKTIGRVPRAADTLTRSLLFTRDNHLVAGSDNDVRVWVDGPGLGTQLFDTGAQRLRTSPDGNWLVANQFDHGFRTVNLQTGEKGLAVSRQYCYSVEFAGNETLVAAAGGAITEWNLATGEETQLVKRTAARVAVDPREPDALFYAYEGEYGLFDRGDRTKVGIPPLQAMVQATDLEFSPDGSIAIACGTQGEILAWNTDTWTLLPAVTRVPGHRIGAHRVRITPEGEVAVSTGFDGTVRFWELKSGTQISRVSSGASSIHRQPLYAMAMSHRGDVVTVGGATGGDVLLIDVATRDALARLQKTKDCRAIAFDPDDKSVYVAEGNAVTVWNVSTGEVTRNAIRHSEDQSNVTSISISGDGKTLTTSCSVPSAPTGLRLWWRKDLTPRKTASGVSPTVFLPDGKLLFTAADNVAVFEFLSPSVPNKMLRRRSLNSLEHPPGRTIVTATAAAVNPADGSVATAYSDGVISLWDADLWHEASFRIGPSNGPINDVAFTPEGRHLITANGNGTLYVLRLGPWKPTKNAVKDLRR